MSRSRGRPAVDYSQALRLLQIMEVLFAGDPVTVPGLMERFNVSRRTINRDLAVLQEAYTIAEGDQDERGFKTWWLAGRPRKEAVPLTVPEMTALYLGHGFYRVFHGSEFGADTEAVFQKLRRRILGRARRGRLETLAEMKLSLKFHVSGCAPDVAAPPDTGAQNTPEPQVTPLAEIVNGLIKEHKLHLTLRAPGEGPAELIVHPYSLVGYEGRLHLLGYHERERKLAAWALDDLARVDWLRGEEFDYPLDFSPAEQVSLICGLLLTGEPKEITLLVEAGLLPRLQQPGLHPGLTVRPLKTGEWEVALRAPLNERLIGWVLSLGPGCRVFGPVGLRQTVRERLARALAQYPEG